MLWFTRFAASVLLACCTLQLPAAVVEHLGQPCRGKNILAGRLIEEPENGKEWLVLSNTSEASNMELLFIDFERNTGRVAKAPAGQGAWVLEPVPGNRLIIGTYYDGKFLVYDLSRMEFVETVQVPGEQYVFTGKLAADGGFYGGTYPGAKLARLDLSTYQVRVWDRESSANLYLRSINHIAGDRLLCTYGMASPVSRIFDPGAGEFTSTPATLRGVKPSAAALWNGHLLHPDGAFDGTTLEKQSQFPFPVPAGDAATVLTNLTTSDTVYFRQKNILFRYHISDTAPTQVAELESRLMTGLRGISRTGKLVGSTGQDYYVCSPDGKEVKRLPIPVESSGRPPHFLKVAPDGKLWGGPWFGQTLFHMDPQTSEVVNTGVVSNRGGEVYDVVFLNGKVYAVAYVGGEVIEYDPAQPWDQWNGKNPRILSSVGPEYIRPSGNVVVGPDSRLYSGWMAKYGTYGGAVAITDPVNGKTELLENPVGAQGIHGLAVNERHIFVGTTLGGNGLGTKPEEKAVFAALDRQTRKPVFVHELERGTATSVKELAYDAVTSTVLVSAGDKLLLFDAQKLAFRPAAAPSLPPVTGTLTCSGSGMAYYGSGNSLVALDLKNGQPATVAQFKGKAEKVAGDFRSPDNPILFVSSGPDVYRIKELSASGSAIPAQ